MPVAHGGKDSSNLEHKEAKVVAWSPQCKCEKFLFSLETVKLVQD